MTSMKVGCCFKCAETRPLVDNHRLCTSCHNPELCPKCRDGEGRFTPGVGMTGAARTKPKGRFTSRLKGTDS